MYRRLMRPASDQAPKQTVDLNRIAMMKSIRGLLFIVVVIAVFFAFFHLFQQLPAIDAIVPAYVLALLVELTIFKRWEKFITLFFFPFDTELRIEDIINDSEFDRTSDRQKLRIISREMRKHIHDLHSLFETSVHITSILDYEQLLNTCLLSVIGQMKSTGAVLLFPQTDHGGMFMPYQAKGVQAKKLRSLKLSATDPLITYFHKRSVPINFREFGFSTPEWAPFRKAGIHMLAPVLHQGKLIGIIGVTGKINRLPYSQSEMEMFSLITNIASVAIANAQLYRKMELISVTDELTGLYNRRFFTKQLRDELARANRFKHHVSLVMFDVDHFKRINDTYGHPVGDKVLAQMGEILRCTARQSDVVSRYGGEEFCALLPQVDKEGAGYFGERIRKRVAGFDFSKHGLPKGDSVTISIGAASYPDDAIVVNELVERADVALYQAKNLGRNRVIVYSPETTLKHSA